MELTDNQKKVLRWMQKNEYFLPDSSCNVTAINVGTFGNSDFKYDDEVRNMIKGLMEEGLLDLNIRRHYLIGLTSTGRELNLEDE